jgi:hypothetical protein
MQNLEHEEHLVIKKPAYAGFFLAQFRNNAALGQYILSHL